MKRNLLILSLVLLFLPSCRKTVDNQNSGTATINNESHLDQTLQTYIYYGFLFSAGKLVSIVDIPPPDIFLINDGTQTNLMLQANNLKNSFHVVGQYSDASSARQVFDTLTSPVVLQWDAMADYLKPNEVLLYRSGSEHYAKMRIISTNSDFSNSKKYSECTFDWVFQPDGSLTFPGK
jgi:hypothetical protein